MEYKIDFKGNKTAVGGGVSSETEQEHSGTHLLSRERNPACAPLDQPSPYPGSFLFLGYVHPTQRVPKGRRARLVHTNQTEQDYNKEEPKLPRTQGRPLTPPKFTLRDNGGRSCLALFESGASQIYHTTQLTSSSLKCRF